MGRELLNLSLSFRPMTTSLTSGMPSRDTCAQAPPLRVVVPWPLLGGLAIRRPWRALAVVQPPMIGPLPPAVRQAMGTSSASVDTFFCASASGLALVVPSGFRLIRSNTWPRATVNGSLR